jgi:hypothetical protein
MAISLMTHARPQFRERRDFVRAARLFEKFDVSHRHAEALRCKLVLKAFDTLFNKRDCKAVEKMDHF